MLTGGIFLIKKLACVKLQLCMFSHRNLNLIFELNLNSNHLEGSVNCPKILMLHKK